MSVRTVVSRPRTPLAKVGIVSIAALLVVGAVALSLLAYGRSGTVADCLNHALRARNASQMHQLHATDKFSGNFSSYLDNALKLKDKSAQLKAFQVIARHSDEWHAAVHAAAISAQQHPLGRC